MHSFERETRRPFTPKKPWTTQCWPDAMNPVQSAKLCHADAFPGRCHSGRDLLTLAAVADYSPALQAVSLPVRPYFYRYGDAVLDLCDVLGSYVPGAKVKLHEVSKVLGLTGKFEGVDGSRVEEMVSRRTDRRSRAIYCERDVPCRSLVGAKVKRATLLRVVMRSITFVRLGASGPLIEALRVC